jgi:hypothetical protein
MPVGGSPVLKSRVASRDAKIRTRFLYGFAFLRHFLHIGAAADSGV